ncbi:2-C-methyl-D-erythritol 4-phosphate cytidylyltransferase [Desulfospira joergensenii]|uniref:2-C-methyl-D-erythritol 4-phosphate cytidylyltransferase n=1 Tax=Desulfospira joergensenii TaxID=53329 RepID=UPI0003B6DDCF|nr:2-C-methyl-D-erythritol 4-phosphate cytidylyltransferase [Desulfospira joergensenii]
MDSIFSIAVIVAGGTGRRMKSRQKKQYMSLGKESVLSRTLTCFARNRHVHEIILVVPEDDMEFCTQKIIGGLGGSKPLSLVSGGNSRQESVFRGLLAAKSHTENSSETMVLIHDGVRPFVPDPLIDTCLARAVEKGGCIPVIELSDTIKEADLDGDLAGKILKTIDRSRYYRAQTPQIFRLDLILKAFDFARETGFTGTDDASLMEHAGLPVYTVQGNLFNIKITTREDLEFAEFLMKRDSI